MVEENDKGHSQIASAFTLLYYHIPTPVEGSIVAVLADEETSTHIPSYTPERSLPFYPDFRCNPMEPPPSKPSHIL